MHRDSRFGAEAELIDQPLRCGQKDHAFPDITLMWAHPQHILSYTKPFEKKKLTKKAVFILYRLFCHPEHSRRIPY
jgi:hypothetical protein